MKAWNFDLLVASAAIVAVAVHSLVLTASRDGATEFKAIALAAACASAIFPVAGLKSRSATRGH